MPLFSYRAFQPNGRDSRGTVNAPSERAAIETLEARGLMPYQVASSDAAPGGTGNIPSKMLPLVTRQLATILSSGTQLAEGLEVLSQQPLPPGTRLVLRELSNDIRSGSPFSDALARFPKVFSSFYVQMVRVGEATGTLDQSLERIADFLEKVAATRAKVAGAVTYPLSVMVLGLLMAFGLMRLVVPQFAAVLNSFGSELPTATKILLSVSDFVSDYTLLLFAPFVALFAAQQVMMRLPGGPERLGKWMLRVPVVGNLALKGEVSLLASTLSTAVNSGAQLVTALDLSAGASRNPYVKGQLRTVRTEVERGRSLKDSFLGAEAGLFPALFVSMVAIGEESGSLVAMLDKIALFYDREVDAAAATLVSLLQPLMIVVLGGMIGSLAYALFSPIFSLVTAGPGGFR
jgi:type IV pilus assembly protein PilC